MITKNNKIKITGYKPFDYQKDIHTGLKKYFNNHIHVVKAKRQVGKSILIENVLLEVALNKSRSVSMLLSPTMDQCRKVYNEMVLAMEGSIILKHKNDSLLTIALRNNSTILFKSAEQRENLRGYTVSGVLCIDEAAYIKDDIFYLVSPFVDANNSPILLCSTPRFKQGFFYDYYNIGIEGDNELVHSYDINNYDTSHLLDPKKLEFYRKTLPMNQFRTEYLGLFMDGNSMVFGEYNSLINNSYDQENKDLYLGIDWGTGKGQDLTALTIFNSKKQMVYVDYFNDKDETETINYIASIVIKYKPKVISVETNSIGNVYYGLLKKKISSLNVRTSVEGFVTTNESKHRLVSQLQVAIQNKEVQFLDNKELLNQMAAYECKVITSGKVTYNGALGTKDDLVMSTLIAFNQLVKPTYNIR